MLSHFHGLWLIIAFSTLAFVLSFDVCTLQNCHSRNESSVMVTMTSGSWERLQLTENLLRSLVLNSPGFANNIIIVCIDAVACQWCRNTKLDGAVAQCLCVSAAGGRLSEIALPEATARTSSNEYSSNKKYKTLPRIGLDNYGSANWTWAVIQKPKILRTLLPLIKANCVVYSDHDVAVRQNIDNICHEFESDVATMCDHFQKRIPWAKMANTGFMIIQNNQNSQQLMSLWDSEMLPSTLNDQSVFQNITKRIVLDPNTTIKHECTSHSDHGLTMWFFRRGRLSGSGLTLKNFVEPDLRNFRVVHMNDLRVTNLKSLNLKKMDLWFVPEPIVETSPSAARCTGMALAPNNSSIDFAKIPVKTWFYIYDWPVTLTQPYLYRLSDTTSYDRIRSCNFGNGELIDGALGQFNTYTHSLYPTVLQRLLNHPRRTLDANKAQWFFIPYDVTFDAYHLRNQQLTEVMARLQNESYFRRNNGRDHFFVDSSEPFLIEKRTVALSFYKKCSLCVKFTQSSRHASVGKWPKLVPIDCTFALIPYTSTWHYYERKVFQKTVLDHMCSHDSHFVDTSVRNQRGNKDHWVWDFDVSQQRKQRVVFVGSIKMMSRLATSIRKYVVHDCELHNKQCQALKLSISPWKGFGDNAKVYRDSTFCLLPQGNIPQRKAIFDAMMAGCIPVIFDRSQLDVYSIHIPATMFSDVAVLIDYRTFLGEVQGLNRTSSHPDDHPLEVVRNVSVVEMLDKISDARITQIRRNLKSLAFRLQYSLPYWEVDKPWTPSQPDALEIMLSYLTYLQDK